MANKPKEKRTPEIIAEARKRIDDALSYDSHNREEALDDLNMKVGLDHWKDDDVDFKAARKADGRPTIEFNRLPGLSSQVIGDLRENRPACKVHPADDKASMEFAGYYEGRIRQIEADCDAESIYDSGAQQAADSGFGNWRIVTDYISDKTFDQTARIEAIENQFAVVWDHLSQKWDKSDARWVAVMSRIAKDEYERKYKGKPATPQQIGKGGPNWYISDTYTLCEYFRRETDGQKTIYLIPDQDAKVSDPEVAKKWETLKVTYQYMLDEVVDKLPEPIAEIWPVLLKERLGRERSVDRTKIVRYLLSGHEMLEESQEWVSDKYWPIVPVSGKSTNVDGKVYRKSVIRDAKGAQKAYNFGWNTALEDVAIVPKSPYLATPTQIKGHEAQWKQANKKTFPYLLYNIDGQAQMPQRTARPMISTAVTEITMRAIDDMRAMTNVFDPSMMQLAPDMSGVAAKARISRSGVANFEFIDNVSRSIGLTWRTLLDVLPKIEDTKRTVATRDVSGATKFEKINWPNEDMKEGSPSILKDLSRAGRYNVAVTPSPSYATQRIEAVDNLTKIAQALPETYQVMGDEIVRNMDYPGAQKMRYRLMASMVMQGRAWLFTQEEMAELLEEYPQLQAMLQPQTPPPDPLTTAVIKRELANAMKSVAQAEKTLMETGQIKAETARQLMDMVNQLNILAGGGSPEQPQSGTEQVPSAGGRQIQ